VGVEFITMTFRRNMKIEEYTTIIQHAFFYLFAEYGFQVMYRKVYGPAADWYRVGLESQTHPARFLFERERGAGVIFLGPLSAPFDEVSDSQWILLMNLLGYILKKEWDWSFAEQSFETERPSIVLSFCADQLYPVYAQILDMVKSQDAIARWRPAYEQYLEQKIQRLYGSSRSGGN